MSSIVCFLLKFASRHVLIRTLTQTLNLRTHLRL